MIAQDEWRTIVNALIKRDIGLSEHSTREPTRRAMSKTCK
jgi:hypothetical protein